MFLSEPTRLSVECEIFNSRGSSAQQITNRKALFRGDFGQPRSPVTIDRKEPLRVINIESDAGKPRVLCELRNFSEGK